MEPEELESEAVVSYLIKGQGTELSSFGRAVDGLSQWTISPPNTTSFRHIFLVLILYERRQDLRMLSVKNITFVTVWWQYTY